MRKTLFPLLGVIALCVGLGAARAQTVNRPRLFQIVTTNLPLPDAGKPYTFQLRAVGGKLPYHWSLPSAGLPAGLNLDPEAGAISGTPQSTDGFSVLVQVTDSSNPPLIHSKLLVAGTEAPLTVRWTAIPQITVSNIVGAVRVKNGSRDVIDMTVIVVAVNETGKAFALRYEHLKLASGAETPDLEFNSSLPLGQYTVHVDAVGEVPAKKAIYRDRRELGGLVVQSQ
jgi:hypothetical protein